MSRATSFCASRFAVKSCAAASCSIARSARSASPAAGASSSATATSPPAAVQPEATDKAHHERDKEACPEVLFHLGRGLGQQAVRDPPRLDARERLEPPHDGEELLHARGCRPVRGWFG